MPEPQLTLYAVPASHPCAAVELALRRKGLAYRRVDLLPLFHVLHQRVVFGRRTVPGLRLGGEKVVGSKAILRVLDGLEPSPPLLPADAARRAKVEGAEAWAEEVLQGLVRRVLWAAAARHPEALSSYAEGADLPVPVSVAQLSAPVTIRLERLLNGASEEAVRADLAALDGHLDRVDALIAEGVLGAGDEVNVADLQVGASLALLLTLDDMKARLGERPAAQLARRLFPDYPGRVPAGSLV